MQATATIAFSEAVELFMPMHYSHRISHIMQRTPPIYSEPFNRVPIEPRG